MSRGLRRLARPLPALLLAGLVAACSGPSPAPAPGAPVVLVSIDTLRADHLAAWGGRGAATPAIDRLIRDGVRFEDAWAQAPLTLPSHATLLTGLLPPAHGVRSNIGYRLDGARFPTLATRLAADGYATGAAVSAYVLRRETGVASGFERFDDSLEVLPDEPLGAQQRSGAAALESLLPWLERAAGGPFLAWLHLFEPHTPYQPPEPWRSTAATPYDGEIAAADAVVGRLLAELDRRDLYDRSLIVLVSDHGEGLGDHGEHEHGILLYREALHVPLVVKLPGSRRAGETATDPAGLHDVVPTVLAALGAPIPGALPGRDLLAGAGPARRIYSETLYPRIHLGWSELRSLADGRLHLIDGPDPELYDYRTDPGERRDLRDEERRRLAELRAELAEIPLDLAAAAPAGDEERARLQALGYLTGSAPETAGPPADPKRHIGELEELQACFELVQRDRLPEALERLRRLVASQPAMVDARIQLAAVARRLGLLDEALEHYREAVRRSPGHLESVAVEIAKVELDRGELDAAAENARLALPGSPDEAHFLLAAVAARRADWATAEAEARAALGDAERPRVPALILLAQVLGERGDPAAGLGLLEGARARFAAGAAAPVPTLEATLGDLLARSGRD
ncbi:MAG TPA: sulfatase-like hydrolase/transferase, partial [Thermoanaerobaculia bacterium]|nr:sulfatase-like hydrolase/transferase [Thermoanaerobaculia bacterium]